ncbi:hypothetical protein E6P72_06580 [Moraxella osloensis]|nr:RelA/SpoT domain-containing protein [Moraxella osloensis]MDI4480757.1 hypothetical protein [Moraxella osloensis]
MENQDKFFESSGLLSTDLAEAKVSKDTLVEILNDYLSNQERLKYQASYFANILQFGDSVNSVKWRIKDPIHLLQKIVRKRKEAIKEQDKNSKYMTIDVENYKNIVNDLIGLRAIYLFKADWYKVNDFILKEFKVCENEPITIYYAPNDDLTQIPDNNFIEANNKKYNLEKKVKEKTNYRSTHYLIEGIPPHNFKFELQTRSILEETWGEIDHYVRYPNFENHPELIRRMSILNGALSACEQMVSTDYEYFVKLSEEELKKNANSLDNINLDAGENQKSSLEQNPKLDRDKVTVSDESWDKDIKTISRAQRKSRLLEAVKNKNDTIKIIKSSKGLDKDSIASSIPVIRILLGDSAYNDLLKLELSKNEDESIKQKINAKADPEVKLSSQKAPPTERKKSKDNE